MELLTLALAAVAAAASAFTAGAVALNLWRDRRATRMRQLAATDPPPGPNRATRRALRRGNQHRPR
jgi:hypothetical protein